MTTTTTTSALTSGEPSPSADATPRGADGAIAHLQALLRLDTTNPPGRERPAIDYVQAVLARWGIASNVFEPVPGRANLVARLPGDGSEGPLLLTSHVDVVAVERERWSRDPFGAEIADGCIWGRGTLDMKGMTALELETFLAIHRSGARLRRDLILLVLCDEEAGMDHGSKWMVKHQPDAIRAEYALNEFGAFALHLGGKRIYPIQTAEKGHVWLELLAEGEPGHGSMPHRANAVTRLARAIAALESRPLAHRVHPAARGFIDVAARVAGVGGVVLKGLLHPRTARLALEALARLQPDRLGFFHALVHQTAAPTMLRAGTKENVIPSEARAVVDGRFVPGTSAEELIALVQERVGREVTVRELSRGDPSESPADSPLFRHLQATIEAHDREAVVSPWLTVGFTDSANLSRLGTKCYGFYPLKLGPEISFQKLIHGHDERVPVEAFRWGYEVFHDAVRRFVAAGA